MLLRHPEAAKRLSGIHNDGPKLCANTGVMDSGLRASPGPGMTRGAFQQTERRNTRMIAPFITRRALWQGSAAAAAVLAMPGGSGAQQAYPTRPIRFVLAFGAGGVADITSR